VDAKAAKSFLAFAEETVRGLRGELERVRAAGRAMAPSVAVDYALGSRS